MQFLQLFLRKFFPNYFYFPCDSMIKLSTVAQEENISFDGDFDKPTNQEIANTIAEWETLKLRLLGMMVTDVEVEDHGEDEEDED